MVHLLPDFDILLVSNPTNVQKQLFDAGREIVLITFWWTVVAVLLESIYAFLFYIPQTLTNETNGRPTYSQLLSRGHSGFISWYAEYIDRFRRLVDYWYIAILYDKNISLLNYSSVTIVCLAAMYLLRG